MFSYSSSATFTLTLAISPSFMRSVTVDEKAGRSQVGSFVVSLSKVFLSCRIAAVAIIPSALSMSVFARCKLGVLVSSVLLPDCRPALPVVTDGSWAGRLTQSPELGLGLCFSSLGMSLSYAVVAIALGLLSSASPPRPSRNLMRIPRTGNLLAHLNHESCSARAIYCSCGYSILCARLGNDSFKKRSVTWREVGMPPSGAGPQNSAPNFRSVGDKLWFVVCCGLGE